MVLVLIQEIQNSDMELAIDDLLLISKIVTGIECKDYFTEEWNNDDPLIALESWKSYWIDVCSFILSIHQMTMSQ